jgi:beta-glucanase (GH16 family)
MCRKFLLLVKDKIIHDSYLSPMKAIIPLLFAIGIALPVFGQRDTIFTGGNICPSGDWQLVFADEFDGNQLDRTKWYTWFPYTNDGSDQCEFCRTSGEGGQVYLDSNVVVDKGSLKLIARRQDAQWYSLNRPYSSGMIHSQQRFGMGRYEIRCKLPFGMGFWPAYWMFGNKGAEIDVFEIGCQKPRRHHMGIISWKNHKTFDKRKWGRTDFSKDFHIFTMEWDPNFVRFRVDGKEIWRVSLMKPKCGKVMRSCNPRKDKYFLQPAFPSDGEILSIIANLAIGTAKTPFTKAPTTSTVFPNQVEIDWIRVYKRK